MSNHNARVRTLNDTFCQSFEGGTVVCTHYVMKLRPSDIDRIKECVKTYDNFTPENDPYKEHDFGDFELKNGRFYWKIDYYADDTMAAGSEDPSDPKQSYRVLTIMHASEY